MIDARVDREEKVYPMVPAGGSATDIIDVEWAEEDNQWVEEGVMTHCTRLSVLVQNRPGVLTRCAGLFARRGFNIESLAVGPTEDASRSRITIRVDCSQHSVDQVTKQLYKLVDVLKVSELGPTAVELELPDDQGHVDAGAAARDHRAWRRCSSRGSWTSAPRRSLRLRRPAG